jgi:hypothetical protein
MINVKLIFFVKIFIEGKTITNNKVLISEYDFTLNTTSISCSKQHPLPRGSANYIELLCKLPSVHGCPEL